ncbi:MAG TPA: TetR/AcrR family transcriptional regulator [Ensifer sp.]|nr:TetR/AcrR family transcriptional regulator [Ensifer sp.]
MTERPGDVHQQMHGAHGQEAHMPVIDRRVARTRTKLERAFFHLMQEKGYDAVTINDICDRAGVGRSTFYTHFTGKDDLKRRSLEHLRAELLESHARLKSVEDQRPFRFMLAMFEHARRHLPAYRALMGSEGLSVSLGTIRDILADLVRAELKGRGTSDGRETTVAFIVGAFMAVMTQWLDDGAKTTPAEMDAHFRRLIEHGVG